MKYLTYLIICSLFAVLGVGCTENFEELNTRPNALIAEEVDASLLGQAFAQSQFSSMHGSPGPFQISENLFSDLFAQYFATTAANFDSDRYVEVGRWIDAAWRSFYGNAAPQIKFVEDLAAKNNLEVEGAVAKIWKVQAYHRQTDYWGPIIYSQFGNGETSVPYENQESIYRSFFPTLDEAVAVLKANQGATVFPADDQIFGGDVNKWLKFANSLRLRLAMRIRYVDPALARTEAEKAVADGVMTDNSDNAQILTTPNSKNPFTTITNWGEFRMSALMESILEGYEDPRLPNYFNPAESGDTDGDGSPYEGLRNGQAKVNKVPALNTDNSDMQTKWLPEGKGGTNPPIRVMCAAEIYFLRAEGALENWNMGGSAQELYEMGIATSLRERTSASEGDIVKYVASINTPIEVGDVHGTQPSTDIPVAFEAGAGKERQLEQIITQKWIALYPDGWEAWAELRRTDYPRIIPLLNSDNPDVAVDEIFRRVTFVSSEFSNNQEAVEAAQQLPELMQRGGDKNSTKLWWDAKN